MRVLYVITGLSTGGAEKQLARLLSHLHGYGIEVSVVSLSARGAVSDEIEELGIPVWHLGLAQPWQLPWAAVRMMCITRHVRPHVIHGWMYHGNLAALFMARSMARGIPVVWGVRQSLYDLQREKAMTRALIRISARLSARAAAIVYNAQLSRRQHEDFGYATLSAKVIGNCFDCNQWLPDDQARDSVRQELGLPSHAPLIGLIARYHPIKGHEVFFDAASRLLDIGMEAHFLLAGRGVTPDTPPFTGFLQKYPDLENYIHLLGERHDIPRLTAALDVASSTSWGEGFSNTIGEALLCAVPVVVTEVGEAREIVGDAGQIVQPGDAKAMAKAWNDLLALDFKARRQIGMIGRNRICNKHGAKAVAQRYLELYRGLVE